ncbi:UvrD-helicase domain-containing protein [Sphingopyxis granuli]|uniref:UvrD-helicase domain-containing protein n=1 Tax=Sphingopyxis granuli TaxID=267128 RepID=UPI001F52EBE7|nr:UvrD-helicase domain-containing protein [Sphingopyxis granuli]UNK79500.1 UvrD-helicase domain-containing protein [Sphingopyxis granuli]
MNNLSIVPAGAGAGKTHHIQETLTRWVREGEVRPERILAVTFTEAAAGELRQRIRAALIRDNNLDAALAVDRAYVSTIHGLGRRLLIEHAFANGASPQQRLIAEDEQDLLIRRAIEENEALNILSRNLSAFGYRGNLNSDETAEDSFRNTLLDVIGLLRRLGPRGSDPAMADYAEASVRAGYEEPQGDSAALAAALKSAIDALLTAFPQSLAPLMKSDTAQRDFRDNFSMLNAAHRTLTKGDNDWRQWQKLRALRQSKRGSATPDGYDDLAASVMQAADRLARHPGPLEDAVAHARALIEGAQSAMADYEARKRQLGVIDFSDMVTNAAQLLADDAAVLSAIMAEVDCVIVDEFQDTNPIQFSFLWNLARRAKHALVVGDTKQAIMGFQGADPRLSEALNRRYSTSPLDRNWRSDPRIMALVNAVGDRLFGEDYAPLSPTKSAGHDTALEAISLATKRSARNGPKPQHFVAYRVRSLLHDEGVTIIDRHTGELRPLEPKDIAILCPRHKLCQTYAGALRELDIDVRVAEGGWWGSPVVRAATFALRYAADPQDRHAALCFAALGPAAMPLDQALKAIADHGRIDLPELAALEALWPASLSAPVDRLVHDVVRAAALRDWCDRLDDPAQMRADLLRFEAEASAFLSAHRDMREASGFYGQGAPVFLGWLESKVANPDGDKRPNPSGSEADGVEVITWHASKGREWPIVIVCGLDNDLGPRGGQFGARFPDFNDLDKVIDAAEITYAPRFDAPEASERFLALLRPEAEQTCRRLLYVALTRARDRLVIEWPLAAEPKEDGPPPITAHAIMTGSCGVSISDNQIHVGDATFSARNLICGTEMSACFEEPDIGDRVLPHGQRSLRHAIVEQVAIAPVAITGPSGAVTANRPLPAGLETIAIAPGVVLTGEELTLATDKGTAIHEAFRILLQRPDLKHRVGPRCRLSEADVEALAAQAEGLRQTLADRGYGKLHVEQPLEIRLDDGGTQMAIIDLLAESADGYLIIDHKSGPAPDPAARFATYWPQLSAYAEVVDGLGGTPVQGVSIFWTDSGEMTVGERGDKNDIR